MGVGVLVGSGVGVLVGVIVGVGVMVGASAVWVAKMFAAICVDVAASSSSEGPPQADKTKTEIRTK